MVSVHSDPYTTWGDTTTEHPAFRKGKRVVQGLVVGGILSFLAWFWTPPPPQPVPEPWVRYARPGDTVWDTFVVKSIPQFSDYAGRYFLLKVVPKETPTESPIEFRIPPQGRVVQWRRQFRFKVNPVQEDIVELDRQNVEQLVSY